MNKSQIENRTLFTGDNLEVMRAVNSESVDLIYLDPPFNKKFVFPIGKGADAKFGFTDIWGFGKGKDDPYLQEAELSAYSELLWASELFDSRPQEILPKKDAKTLVDFLEMMGRVADESAMAYLSFMAIRLLEMKRVLKPTGSIYLHCDQTMGHFIKLLMDIVFGAGNFQNEIVWGYRRWSAKSKRFQRMHDIVFFYTKENGRHCWTSPMEPKAPATAKFKQVKYIGDDGKLKNRVDKTQIVSDTAMRDLWDIGRLAPTTKERVGYPTQKPLKLLERIILASSNEGDLILDPFCGCATTCIAAERLGRGWLGIDVAEEAARQVKIRLDKETEQGTLAAGERQVHHRLFKDKSQRPMRTDIVRKRSRNIKSLLYGVQNGNCNLCGGHFEIQHFHLDHIVAKARGGLDVDDNLQLLCGHCNSVKSVGTMQRARERLRKLGYAA